MWCITMKILLFIGILISEVRKNVSLCVGPACNQFQSSSTPRRLAFNTVAIRNTALCAIPEDFASGKILKPLPLRGFPMPSEPGDEPVSVAPKLPETTAVNEPNASPRNTGLNNIPQEFSPGKIMQSLPLRGFETPKEPEEITEAEAIKLPEPAPAETQRPKSFEFPKFFEQKPINEESKPVTEQSSTTMNPESQIIPDVSKNEMAKEEPKVVAESPAPTPEPEKIPTTEPEPKAAPEPVKVEPKTTVKPELKPAPESVKEETKPSPEPVNEKTNPGPASVKVEPTTEDPIPGPEVAKEEPIPEPKPAPSPLKEESKNTSDLVTEKPKPAPEPAPKVAPPSETEKTGAETKPVPKGVDEKVTLPVTPTIEVASPIPEVADTQVLPITEKEVSTPLVANGGLSIPGSLGTVPLLLVPIVSLLAGRQALTSREEKQKERAAEIALVEQKRRDELNSLNTTATSLFAVAFLSLAAALYSFGGISFESLPKPAPTLKAVSQSRNLQSSPAVELKSDLNEKNLLESTKVSTDITRISLPKQSSVKTKQNENPSEEKSSTSVFDNVLANLEKARQQTTEKKTIEIEGDTDEVISTEDVVVPSGDAQ